MIKEFKDFISRGNVLDLTVGVTTGSAFTSIVSSLVTNLLGPFLGLSLGKVDLSDLTLKVGGVSFKFSNFINPIINFLIIAFVVFLIVKSVSKPIPRPEQKPADPTPEQKYLREIRDLLKNK